MDSDQPRRGEIWLTSLGAARPGEPGKAALVLSVDELVTGLDEELFVVVPLSRSRAPSSLRPWITPKEGVAIESAAICRAIRSVARTRLLRPIGRVSAQTMAEVERAVAVILGLDRR